MTVGLKKLAAGRRKLHDPRFISFESLPACDGQMDMPRLSTSCSSIAEHDNRDEFSSGALLELGSILIFRNDQYS